MFSARKGVAIGALALAGVALATSQAALADVVVKASGPSAAQYPVGTKLNDTATITLREGDVVTILGTGGTRVLRGAGTFQVSDRGAAAQSRFAALTRQRAAARVRTGAVRTGDAAGPLLSPNLWYVDVSHAGTVCLYNLATVRLWRPATEGESTYVVTEEGSPVHAHVTFGDGQMVAALDPAALTLSAGGHYTISGPGGSAPVEISVELLQGEFDQPDDLAQALIAKGCTTQLDLLAASLSDPAA